MSACQRHAARRGQADAASGRRRDLSGGSDPLDAGGASRVRASARRRPARRHLTERAVLLRIAGRVLEPERTLVNACMTPEPVTLPADSSVAYALHIMVLEGFRHIPVMDEAGKPTAVVSMSDLIEYLSDFFNRGVLNLPPEPHVKYRSREGA
jgi:hypothetical protein